MDDTVIRHRESTRYYKNLLSVATPALGALLLFTSPARAFDGMVFPDSSNLVFQWQSNLDTVTVTIENLSGGTIADFYVADLSLEPATLAQCLIDGVPSLLPVESEFGAVDPYRYTTHFLVGDFSQTVSLTYHAASHESGHISWAAAGPFPAFGITSLDTAGCCAGLRGNIDGDPSDRTDIADLVYFVNWAVNSPAGPSPPCLAEADVDGSGGVDIADLVYMSRWMFNMSGGLPPVYCEQ